MTIKTSWRWVALAAGSGLAIALAVALLVPAGAALDVVKPAFGAAVTVNLPDVSLLAVSCTGDRACVAGGAYIDSAVVRTRLW